MLHVAAGDGRVEQLLDDVDRLEHPVDALVGLGPENERLFTKARDLGVLGERVIFPGYREDVGRIMAAADQELGGAS